MCVDGGKVMQRENIYIWVITSNRSPEKLKAWYFVDFST